MSLMIKLQDIPYIISYEIGDIKTIPDLIEDIGESVKKRLTDEIKNKPLKCNITIVYSSIFNEEYDSKSMGQQGQ